MEMLRAQAVAAVVVAALGMPSLQVDNLQRLAYFLVKTLTS
jgi:hypothetical protein